MARPTRKVSRRQGVRRAQIRVVEVDGYLTKFWEIVNYVAALEVEDWIPVKPGTIGSLSDYIRMGGGDHQDFLAVKRALQRFPVLWSSPAQMPKAREWDPDPKELVVYHVRRFKLEKAEPTYTQTIRWFQRVFNITNPVVWYEEDTWG